MKPGVAHVVNAVPCPLTVARFVSGIDRQLADLGLKILCSSDFVAFEELCASLPGKGQASEFFSSRFFEITPRDGFWLRAIDEQGSTVHVQAMRVDRLDGMTLAEHWRRRYRRLYEQRQQGVRWDGTTSPIAEEITGTVVYHGDMYIDRNLPLKGISGPLAHVALGLALSKWEPDYVYGLVDYRFVRQGFTIREGYAHTQRFCAGWIKAPQGVEADESIVWMTRDDLIYLTARPLEWQLQARIKSA